MFEEVTKGKKPNREKLIEYGFVAKEGRLEYRAFILNECFCLSIYIDSLGAIETSLYDVENDDEYSLYKTNAAGEYVGTVREAVREQVVKVVDYCFANEAFWFPQTLELIAHVKRRFNDDLDFPWGDFEGAVFRKKDNRKWYALIMSVNKKRLGFDSEERTEVLNIKYRVDSASSELKKLPILPAYHMNKKTWATIILDGGVPNDVLFALIEDSYKNT